MAPLVHLPLSHSFSPSLPFTSFAALCCSALRLLPKCRKPHLNSRYSVHLPCSPPPPLQMLRLLLRPLSSSLRTHVVSDPSFLFPIHPPCMLSPAFPFNPLPSPPSSSFSLSHLPSSLPFFSLSLSGHLLLPLSALFALPRLSFLSAAR